MDLARESLHISVELLWLLENYMSDVKNVTHNALAYLRAARVLLELQRMIFRQDFPEHEFGATRKLILRATELLDRKFQTRSLPSPFLCTAPPLVAVGCAMASVCSPNLVPDMRQLILMQGRKGVLLSHDHYYAQARRSRSINALELAATSNHSSIASSPIISSRTSNIYQLEGLGPSLEDLSNGRAFSFRHYITLTAKNFIPKSPAFAKASSQEAGDSSFDLKAQAPTRHAMP